MLQSMFCPGPVVIPPGEGMVCSEAGCRPGERAVWGLVDVRVSRWALWHPLCVPLPHGWPSRDQPMRSTRLGKKRSFFKKDHTFFLKNVWFFGSHNCASRHIEDVSAKQRYTERRPKRPTRHPHINYPHIQVFRKGDIRP